MFEFDTLGVQAFSKADLETIIVEHYGNGLVTERFNAVEEYYWTKNLQVLSNEALNLMLAINFKEDLNRTSIGYADANLSTMNQIAQNILKLDKSKKSLNLKRYNTPLDDNFRESPLNI